MGYRIKNISGSAAVEVVFKFEAKPTDRVFVAGDFNHWNPKSIPLSFHKKGYFGCTILLPAKNKFEYRFVVNEEFVQDPTCEASIWNSFAQAENSVLAT
ncbi:MAG: isoamylase early set domain-containing protein [Flavobacteriaceae bacterium]